MCTFYSGIAGVKGTPLIVWDSWRRTHRPIFPVLALAFQDTPWRSMWALTTGHSGLSGCDLCFQRGSTMLESGERLGSVRWLGCHHPAPFCAFDEHGNWVTGETKLSTDEGTFDAGVAGALMVTDVLHKLRCAEADSARKRALDRCPLPIGASHGGSLTADPSSAEQARLTKGANNLYHAMQGSWLHEETCSCGLWLAMETKPNLCCGVKSVQKHMQNDMRCTTRSTFRWAAAAHLFLPSYLTSCAFRTSQRM